MSDQGVGAAQVLRAILPGRAPHEDRVAPIRVHHLGQSGWTRGSRRTDEISSCPG